MQQRTSDGVTLHVQELGSGPPVVMLHGLLVGNMTSWYFSCAPALAKKHRVILFDFRGHGMSERAPRGYDLATMARDLESIVDNVAREPVDLIGHSYGATVALTFALRRPERVKKLCVVESPLPPSGEGELESLLASGPDAMLGALPSVLRDTAMAGGRRGKRFVESLRFLAYESSLMDDLRHAEDIPDAALASLACPLLAVYGTASSCRSVGARLSRVVPGARLVELPGGHFLPLEAPGPLTDTVVGFVDGPAEIA
jgi:pimeloyl-ACP methyl ester carboxylesterase